jgi:hypothetical protein
MSAFGKAALLQRSLAALAAREVASFLSANEASPAFELKELRPVLMLFRSPLFLGPDLSSSWDGFFSELAMVRKLLWENIILEKETRSDVKLLYLLVVLFNCEWTIFAMPTYTEHVNRWGKLHIYLFPAVHDSFICQAIIFHAITSKVATQLFYLSRITRAASYKRSCYCYCSIRLTPPKISEPPATGEPFPL